MKKTKVNMKPLIEKPISSKTEDIFNLSAYVSSIKTACNEGASFIAIDGDQGTGKSSVINLFKENLSYKFKLGKIRIKNNMVKFVNINFLNIDTTLSDENYDNIQLRYDNTEDAIKDDNDIKKDDKKRQKNNDYSSPIEKYNRYFVNEAINDIYNDPNEFEKLFYYNSITYGVAKPGINKYARAFLNAIIMLAISVIVVLKVSSFVYTSIPKEIVDILNQAIILSFSVLLISSTMYGISIFKPDDVTKSPILDIDRCRNNFVKAIFNNLKAKSTLYIIIDDLDRMNDSCFQSQIISMIYNEYLPLNLQFKKINIKFIFMIDLKKMPSDMDTSKIFDYIIPIANNQSIILKKYIKNKLEEQFADIYGKINNIDFILREIVSEYTTIRNIKHFLNKVLLKKEYLDSKKIKYNNYDQLFVMGIIIDKYSINDSCDYIEKRMTDINFKKSEGKPYGLINRSFDKNIIDQNYYLYIYNFINEEDVFYPTEIEIDNLFKNEEAYQSINVDNLHGLINSENTRMNKIYEDIYIYLTNDDNKAILLSCEKFYKHLMSLGKIDRLIEDVSFSNIINYDFSYGLVKNLLLDRKYFDLKSNEILFEILEKKSKISDILSSEEENEELNQLTVEYSKSLNNAADKLRENLRCFETGEIFKNLEVNGKLYESLFKLSNDEFIPVGYYLYLDGKIAIESIADGLTSEFFLNLSNYKIPKIEDYRKSIERKLFNESTDEKLIISILHDGLTEFNDEEIYEKIKNLKSLKAESTIKIIEKTGYNREIDFLIIQNIEDRTLQEYITSNEFDLSVEILNAINAKRIYKQYNVHMENLFEKNLIYKPFIYSIAKRVGSIEYDTERMKKPEYKNAMFEIFSNINKDSWENFPFDQKSINYILKRYNFNKMVINSSNLWKFIRILENCNRDQEIDKIFGILNEKNILNSFASETINTADFSNLKVLGKLKELVNDETVKVDSTTKGKLTKKLNKLNKAQ